MKKTTYIIKKTLLNALISSTISQPCPCSQLAKQCDKNKPVPQDKLFKCQISDYHFLQHTSLNSLFIPSISHVSKCSKRFPS